MRSFRYFLLLVLFVLAAGTHRIYFSDSQLEVYLRKQLGWENKNIDFKLADIELEFWDVWHPSLMVEIPSINISWQESCTKSYSAKLQNVKIKPYFLKLVTGSFKVKDIDIANLNLQILPNTENDDCSLDKSDANAQMVFNEVYKHISSEEQKHSVKKTSTAFSEKIKNNNMASSTDLDDDINSASVADAKTATIGAAHYFSKIKIHNISVQYLQNDKFYTLYLRDLLAKYDSKLMFYNLEAKMELDSKYKFANEKIVFSMKAQLNSPKINMQLSSRIKEAMFDLSISYDESTRWMTAKTKMQKLGLRYLANSLLSKSVLEKNNLVAEKMQFGQWLDGQMYFNAYWDAFVNKKIFLQFNQLQSKGEMGEIRIKDFVYDFSKDEIVDDLHIDLKRINLNKVFSMFDKFPVQALSVDRGSIDWGNLDAKLEYKKDHSVLSSGSIQDIAFLLSRNGARSWENIESIKLNYIKSKDSDYQITLSDLKKTKEASSDLYSSLASKLDLKKQGDVLSLNATLKDFVFSPASMQKFFQAELSPLNLDMRLTAKESKLKDLKIEIAFARAVSEFIDVENIKLSLNESFLPNEIVSKKNLRLKVQSKKLIMKNQVWGLSSWNQYLKQKSDIVFTGSVLNFDIKNSKLKWDLQAIGANQKRIFTQGSFSNASKKLDLQLCLNLSNKKTNACYLIKSWPPKPELSPESSLLLESESAGLSKMDIELLTEF